MGRPIEATSPLDLDTIKLLLWASEYGSGKPNISRLYDQEAQDGLELARGTFFGAIKGRPVTKETAAKIDELVALRGWHAKWSEHLREEHHLRVVQAFKKTWTNCSVCGHECSHCGAAQSERRRKAVTDYLKTDPVKLGCVVQEP
jgi:hypothetical protein